MLVYCSERTWTPGYKGPMCRYVYSSVKGNADEMAGKAWLLESPTAKQHRCAEDLGVQTQSPSCQEIKRYNRILD
jgi:hypothetical protein